MNGKDGLVGGAQRRCGGEGMSKEARAATEGCTRGKSILCLQRKEFMKLEHKRSHVQLAPLNLRGEAEEEVGGDMVIKTSAETNKACSRSLISSSYNFHSELGLFQLF